MRTVHITRVGAVGAVMALVAACSGTAATASPSASTAAPSASVATTPEPSPALSGTVTYWTGYDQVGPEFKTLTDIVVLERRARVSAG